MLYPAYEARVVKFLPQDRIPQHVGVMLDGNRRWARSVGADTAHGYRAGADNIQPLLGWCDEVGIEVVTLWLLSTDNLNRESEELTGLLDVIGSAVESLAATSSAGGSTRWAPSTSCRPRRRSGSRPPPTPPVTSTGCWSTSPSGTAGAARSPTPSARCSPSRPPRAAPSSSSPQIIDAEHIAEHLYTKGQPDPDLVIRTSGEQRLGGFLLWQSTHSEFYFCEALWPDFRRVDFLRAIRAYAERERRFGS